MASRSLAAGARRRRSRSASTSSAGAPFGDDAAAIEDDDAGADRFDLGQDVRRQDDGALLAERGDERQHVAALVGIEAVGGLVEDEHVGAMQERIGEPDALAIALRQLADDAPPLGRERDGGERLVDARPPILARRRL